MYKTEKVLYFKSCIYKRTPPYSILFLKTIFLCFYEGFLNVVGLLF